MTENQNKGFHYVPAHSSLGIEGKITDKSVIKGVKAAQKIVFGSKMVKTANLTSTSI